MENIRQGSSSTRLSTIYLYNSFLKQKYSFWDKLMAKEIKRVRLIGVISQSINVKRAVKRDG